MNISSRLIAASFICLALAGCATSRSTLDVPAPTLGNATPSNGKTVLINSVTDKRIFQDAPSSPDIPSLDPSEEQGEKIKLRAVGRKRNSYGKALGDMLLKEDKTVETVTSLSIAKAFSDRGYRVLANKSEATNDTLIVDATIEKFWSWMNPGFVAITLSSEIATDLTIKGSGSKEMEKVSVKASDNYQMATESNWVEVIDKALRLYADELKAKIK